MCFDDIFYYMSNKDISSIITVFETKEIVFKDGARLCHLISCYYCGTHHYKAQCEILRGIKRNKRFYCSRACYQQSQITKQLVTCANCNKSFFKNQSQIKQTNNNFCSKSCAATFNNKNKKYGIRRSKLEKLIEEHILQFYPNLQFLCNNKEIIGSELDFYFPSLRLAIQINGIFHSQPIYGQEKLDKIIQLDQEKRDKCNRLLIKLIEIDCSTDKYLNKSLIKKRLEEIDNILAETRELESHAL